MPLNKRILVTPTPTIRTLEPSKDSHRVLICGFRVTKIPLLVIGFTAEIEANSFVFSTLQGGSACYCATLSKMQLSLLARFLPAMKMRIRSDQFQDRASL